VIENILRREDHRKYSLSQNELERRWKAVRDRMAERKIDFLVMESQQRYCGSYVRYFTDLPGANYPITAIFPLEGEITIVGHGAPPPARPMVPPVWALRGAWERLVTEAMPNVYWENAFNAERALEAMMKKKPKTVGLVGLGIMSAAMYENLKKGLQGVNVIDASDLVDEVKMVKSEEELKLLREAAYMHEMSYEVLKKALRPGRLAIEVIREIRLAQMQFGSEEQQIFMQFGPPGHLEYMQMYPGNGFERRTLKDGDVVNTLIESNAAGGYWYDLRRFLRIGSAAPNELKEAYDIAKEAKAIIAANLKPGSPTSVALDASDQFLKSKGCPPESRVAGHGQGVDLVERPIIHRKEPAKLEAGMVLSFHPTAITKSAVACIADTYVVTESGAVPMHENLFNDNEIPVVG
jgi:Xaa-Pro aminopeptidase